MWLHPIIISFPKSCGRSYIFSKAKTRLKRTHFNYILISVLYLFRCCLNKRKNKKPSKQTTTTTPRPSKDEKCPGVCIPQIMESFCNEPSKLIRDSKCEQGTVCCQSKNKKSSATTTTTPKPTRKPKPPPPRRPSRPSGGGGTYFKSLSNQNGRQGITKV